MSNYQYTPGPCMGVTESLTIGIRAHGLKGCLILLKNESCQNCVLTIPLCRGGRDEATGKNGVKIGRRTWSHSPSLSGRAFAHARRRAPRVPRVFFARMGWPNPNTSWPDPHGWLGYEWRQHDIIVMSACTVGMPGMTSAWCNCDVSMHSRHARSLDTSSTSQQTRQQSGTHLPHHQPRAEPSRFEAEPSREPRDKFLCSRVYVQPDLRLNLGRSSGQNCFDQILAVWNAIWTIADLFPANLIIPNAMVRSDRWDLRPKMAVVN